METQLHFNFKDVFRAARYGFSGKKMGLHFCGFVLGYVIYLVLIYLAIMLSGMPIDKIWGLFGLFPLPLMANMPWYSWLLTAVAGLLCLIIWLMSSTAVARITYQQLKGDEFYSIKDSLSFVRKNWKAVFLSPLSVIIFIVFLGLCGAVIGLIAQIPYVGELGFALFFGVPIFIVAVFTIFLLIILAVSLILTPAIVATTGEDTFETIIQLFSSTWSQPWRLLLYELLLSSIQLVAMAIFSWFTVQGFALIYRICGWWMQPKLAHLTIAAGKYLPKRSLFDLPIFTFMGRLRFSPNFSALIPASEAPEDMVLTMDVAGFLIGITLILVAFYVFAYGASIYSVGQTLTYLILRNKKDDENLLERKEEEEAEGEEKFGVEKKDEKGEVKAKEEKEEEKVEKQPTGEKKEEQEKEEENE